MEFTSFSKIGQYRNAVKEMLSISAHNPEKTTFTFEGTVKIHGTNAAFGYCPVEDSIFIQRRNRIITPEDDNAGFAKWVQRNQAAIHELLLRVGNGKRCIIYGEWAGKNIQSGVAVSQLDKFFCAFHVKVDDVSVPFTLTQNDFADIDQAYSITVFPTYAVVVDTLRPEAPVPKLTRLTDKVEEACPVGRYFGVEGVGEGIVWRCVDPGYESLVFKVKGEKHSVSKVKKLVQVDPQKMESIQEFVDYAVTENRLNQGIETIGLAQSTIGAFIGWVNKDISDEEADVLEANGLTMKDVGKYVSNAARNHYLKKLNFVGDAA